MGAVAEESSGAAADGWESPSVVQAVGSSEEDGAETFPVSKKEGRVRIATDPSKIWWSWTELN